ncbi:DMT family transporter [Micromonospora sp. NBC_01699]|uniref:DMT family transporter n=1 Tax=Micromonospora sp. NBC_01699 TaxID=2975984 RepID=UPI002E33FF42|nr:DMT family transporter [Micromonospora sp. NBC_01699]
MKILPAWLALGLAVLGGVGSAVQSAANAELGARVGNAAMGAVVNNAGGVALLLVALLALPSMRSGFGVLRRARLPWWSYLGGIGGGGFVVIATYVVPALGVAVFTIAQVAGNSAGGLAVDRVGLAPGGRRAVTAPRLLGALLGIGAVALAQFGRPLGDLAVGLVALAAAGGVAVALSAALNGRISAVGGAATGTAVNFAVSTPAIVAVAAVAGAFARFGEIDWPSAWYLYLGGPVGVGVVVALLVCVRSVGVLRSGLAIVAGQLGGALLLDVFRPGGPGASAAVLAGALLTLLAVVVSGRAARPAPTGG